MTTQIELLKGIHPGRIIGRELHKRDISQRAIATHIGEHSQTLNAVINGHRNLTTEMAVKLEQCLGYDEGFLLTLQAFYSIAEYKKRLATTSVTGIPNVRRILFWDTDFDSINWGQHRDSVIRRVLEYGNSSDISEIARYYNLHESDLKKYRQSISYRKKINANR